jgi:hypothetical protein
MKTLLALMIVVMLVGCGKESTTGQPAAGAVVTNICIDPYSGANFTCPPSAPIAQ